MTVTGRGGTELWDTWDMPVGGRMQLKEIVRWNVRVSFLYAVGIWTMLGTYSFFHLKKKREPAAFGNGTPDSAAVTYQEEISFEPQKQAPKEFVETKVVTKEGFVPFSSRIYKYGKSLSGVSPDTSIEK